MCYKGCGWVNNTGRSNSLRTCSSVQLTQKQRSAMRLFKGIIVVFPYTFIPGNPWGPGSPGFPSLP